MPRDPRDDSPGRPARRTGLHPVGCRAVGDGPARRRDRGARRSRDPGRVGPQVVTGDPLDAYFDRPWRVARKLETGRTVVAPGEAERIQAFERGEPRPVRSVRTTPYLARVAVTTVTE